jgi:O-antigen ligase
MLIRRPILGVGIGAYPVARRAWYNWSVWAHNLYGQLMGELGILGTAAWGLMVFYTVKYARTIRKETAGAENLAFIHYLMLAVELSTYTRLVLGMTNHALHISFWYVNAALVAAAWYITRAELGETET